MHCVAGPRKYGIEHGNFTDILSSMQVFRFHIRHLDFQLNIGLNVVQSPCTSSGSFDDLKNTRCNVAFAAILSIQALRFIDHRVHTWIIVTLKSSTRPPFSGDVIELKWRQRTEWNDTRKALVFDNTNDVLISQQLKTKKRPRDGQWQWQERDAFSSWRWPINYTGETWTVMRLRKIINNNDNNDSLGK